MIRIVITILGKYFTQVECADFRYKDNPVKLAVNSAFLTGYFLYSGIFIGQKM